MEKQDITEKNQLRPPINKKAVLSEKIESLWEKSSNVRTIKCQKKKLVLKLETSGIENRKILLKLESGNSKVNSSNYNLLSELLKGFFNSNGRLE